jgi:hypothetical protein
VMTLLERWTHHLANLLVGGTGLVYALMRYLMKPVDPYAVVHHPLQPHVQHLHVIVAPLLVFAVGVSWQRHIAPRLRRRGMQRYRSGITIVTSFLPMVLSGYLIQTTTGETWRNVWIVVHLASSILWLTGYLVHQLQSAESPETSSLSNRQSPLVRQQAPESRIVELRRAREEKT